MTLDLGTIDWNGISAISTLLAVLVALFYQPFLNRRKLNMVTGIISSPAGNEHYISLRITNLSAGPIWMESFGYLYKEEEKVVVFFLGSELTPKMLAPSEPISLSDPAIINHLDSFDSFFAKDSYGKFWYLKRKQCKELKEQIEICIRNNPKRKKVKSYLVAKPK